MRSTTAMLAAALLGAWTSACAAPVATCSNDDDCPGDLVCDAPTGVCALTDRDGRGEGERHALAEGAAPVDDALVPDGDAPPAEEPSPEEPPADEDDDDDGDWSCWPADDDNDDDTEDDVPDDGEPDGGADDAGSEAGGPGQCLALEEPCSFDDDACCQHTHCCPVFSICVPNFWE